MKRKKRKEKWFNETILKAFIIIFVRTRIRYYSLLQWWINKIRFSFVRKNLVFSKSSVLVEIFDPGKFKTIQNSLLLNDSATKTEYVSVKMRY